MQAKAERKKRGAKKKDVDDSTKTSKPRRKRKATASAQLSSSSKKQSSSSKAAPTTAKAGKPLAQSMVGQFLNVKEELPRSNPVMVVCKASVAIRVFMLSRE